MPFLAITEIFYTIERFLFPISCVGCGMTLDRSHSVCNVCLETQFMRCDRENAQFVQNRPYPESIGMHQSVFQFRKNTAIQDVMHELKYAQNWRVGIQFGRIMGERFSYCEVFSHWKSAYVAAIPLHPKKFRKRGYNQAQLLADGFCDATGNRALSENHCRRTANTKTQTALSLEERQKNLNKVFEIDPLPKNCKVIIIDDVFTTGATTFEFADALMEAGALEVGIVTLALS